MFKLQKEVKQYIKESFYKITNKQGFLVYHRVEDDTTIHNSAIQNLVWWKIGCIDIECERTVVNGVILSAVPMIRSIIYKPVINSRHLIDKSSATLDYNLNTYKPSVYQTETSSKNSMPTLFDCYFKRLFPDDDVREGFLYWLAGLVHKPNKPYAFAPVLVGASGTGKSFLIDSVIKPLIGDSNYQRITMHQLNGRFGIGVSTVSLIYCDELKKDKGAKNNLLSNIGNKGIAVENKGENVTTENVTASFIFSSNYKEPFEPDENLRRRMKLLPYIEHKDNMGETSKFIGELAEFIESYDGLMELNRYLLKLSNAKVSHNRISQQLTIKHKVTMEDKTLKAIMDAGDIVFTESIKVELGIPKNGSSSVITKVLKGNGYKAIGSRINPLTGKKSRCWAN